MGLSTCRILGVQVLKAISHLLTAFSTKRDAAADPAPEGQSFVAVGLLQYRSKAAGATSSQQLDSSSPLPRCIKRRRALPRVRISDTYDGMLAALSIAKKPFPLPSIKPITISLRSFEILRIASLATAYSHALHASCYNQHNEYCHRKVHLAQNM